MRRALIVVAALSMLLAACGGDDDPAGSLTVVVEHPDHETVEYEVQCDGDDASISPDVAGIDAGAACQSLADPLAVSRLVDGPDNDMMCAHVFGGSDVATITGTIDGNAVDTTISRTDGCGVSDWDDLLGGLLPPPAV